MLGRIKVATAAKLLGVGSDTLRYMMKNNMLNIGEVIPGENTNMYLIRPNLLAEHMGITADELENGVKSLDKRIIV